MKSKYIRKILLLMLLALPLLTQAQTLYRCECWFDDDIANRIYIGLSGTEKEFTRSLDTEQLSVGIHRFNIRVKQNGGEYPFSPVSTSTFQKLASGKIEWLEYWIDGDITSSQKIAAVEANGGKEYRAISDLDFSTLPVGQHRLSMRGVSSNGLIATAVTSTPFIKQGSGEVQWLEYWVDGDKAHSKKVKGTAASDGNGYTFVKTLDLSNVSPGHHRLYFRGVGETAALSTSVTSAPLIAKSRYDNIQPEDVKLHGYSIAIDNQSPIVTAATGAVHETMIRNDLDLRKLSQGQHQFKMNVWNSLGVGVTIDTTFTVVKTTTPTIQLNAQENGGLVNLTYNSIPNDVRYRIVRTSSDGTHAYIGVNKNSCYPNNVTFTDDPQKGSYTYKVQARYLDADNNAHVVNSNEVTVNVAQAHNTAYGRVSGRIVGETGKPIYYGHFKILLNDGNETIEIKNDFTGYYSYNKIPVGTVLHITATINQLGWTFEEKTVTIKEGDNYVDIQALFDEANYEEALWGVRSHELQLASNVEFEPGNYIKFSVRNISGRNWNGYIRLTSSLENNGSPEQPAGASVGTGSVAPFSTYTPNDIATSDRFSLAPNGVCEVYIKHLLSPIQGGYDEAYYDFLIESHDDYGDKLVDMDAGFNISDNPFTQLVASSALSLDDEREQEEMAEGVVNLILSMCSALPELDGKLGEMESYLQFGQDILGQNLEYYKLAEKIEHATNYSELLDNLPGWKLTRIVYQEDSRFLSMINMVRDDLHGVVKASENMMSFLKKAKRCLDQVHAIQNWQDMDELERAGAVAEKIMSLSSQYPLAKLFKTYLDVTKISIGNIKKIGAQYQQGYLAEDFEDGVIKYQVKIKKKTWIRGCFDEEDVKENILRAQVVAKNTNPANSSYHATAIAELAPVVENDKLYLKLVGSVMGDNISEGTHLYHQAPLDDLQLTIWWRNGRISHIPLRSSGILGDGVKYDNRVYSITFRSKTNDKEHMVDLFELDD